MSELQLGAHLRIAELEKALAEAQVKLRKQAIRIADQTTWILENDHAADIERLTSELAEAQQARDRAAEEWLNRLRLAVTERDSLRTQLKLKEQDWEAERGGTLRGLLREAQTALIALASDRKDSPFDAYVLERITAALKEGQ